MKKVCNYFSKNWLLFFVILQPIMDLLSYYQIINYNRSYMVFIRLLILIILILYSFINSSNRKKFILINIPIILLYIIHIVHLFIINRLNFYLDTKYFIQTFQYPIIAICLISYIKNDISKINLLKKGIVISYVILFFSVILSILTNSFEYTYPDFHYGVTGWFSGTNTPAIIWVAICPLVLYIVMEKKNFFLNLYFLLTVFFILYINGTRTCYLALIATLCIFIYLFIVNIKKDNNKRNLILYIVFLFFSVFLYKYSYCYQRLNDVKENEKGYDEIVEIDKNTNISNDFEDNKNKSEEILSSNDFEINLKPKEEEPIINNEKEDSSTINKEEYDSPIIDKEKEEQIELLKSSYIFRDLIEIHGEDAVYEEMKGNINSNTLPDNRLLKRVNARIEINKVGNIAKVFGIGYSTVAKNSYDLENDITAILYYYGYFGIIVYAMYTLYFIYLSVVKFIKEYKTIYNFEYVICLFLICLLIFGGEYSGAFLRKTNASIYLSFVVTLLYFNLKNVVKGDK